MGREQTCCGFHISVWLQTSCISVGNTSHSPSGSFLYHTEFKRPHAERVGEAQCGIHGDRYSCVTTAAGRRQCRIFLFHFTCIVTTVIPTRPIEWDGFLASGLLRLFFPLVSLTLSPPASPRVTLSLHLFFVAVVTSALCSVHHRAPCSAVNSNISYCQPPTLPPVVNYQNSNSLCSSFQALWTENCLTEETQGCKNLISMSVCVLMWPTNALQTALRCLAICILFVFDVVIKPWRCNEKWDINDTKNAFHAILFQGVNASSSLLFSGLRRRYQVTLPGTQIEM